MRGTVNWDTAEGPDGLGHTGDLEAIGVPPAASDFTSPLVESKNWSSFTGCERKLTCMPLEHTSCPRMTPAPLSGTKTRLCHKANSLAIKFLLGLALFIFDFSLAMSLVDEHSQMNLNSETSGTQAVFSALTSWAVTDYSMTCQVINYDLINL